MKKEQAAWLVIRTIGLIFAWMAITTFAGFAYMVYLLNSDGLTSLRQSVGGTFSWEIAWPRLFMLVTYGFLGFYFLRRGESCHNLICSESITRDSPENAGSDENDW
jgi:hypothetical protein